MELKMNFYDDRLCRKNKRELTAPDFGLSTAVCEEVLQIINIDAFADGIGSLSDESLYNIAFSVIRNGLPYFTDLLKEVFDVKGEVYFQLSEAATVLVHIVKYSFAELKTIGTHFGGGKQKN